MMKNIRIKPTPMIFLSLVVQLLMQGCATPSRQIAVPVALQDEAQIPGLPDIRYRVGKDQTDLAREGLKSVRREQAYLAASGHKGSLPPAKFLANSGDV
jgi:hypothetical protein